MSNFVVVAHRGLNSYGHQYSDEALQSMADGLNGGHVMERRSLDPDGDLKALRGFVEEARFVEGRVEVAVNWFSGARPHGQYLTPIGRGMIAKNIVFDYKPEGLSLSVNSSFSGATKIL